MYPSDACAMARPSGTLRFRHSSRACQWHCSASPSRPRRRRVRPRALQANTQQVQMLLVLGGGLGAGMPAVGLVGPALERVQAAELRHAGDPGRVVFHGQDGQHLLQGGDGVVVAAAQYRQVGEMPQHGALGQGIAGLREPVRGTAQQQLRLVGVGALRARRRPWSARPALGSSHPPRPPAAPQPPPAGRWPARARRRPRPARSRAATRRTHAPAGHRPPDRVGRLFPVGQGIVAALREGELLGEGQRPHPPRGGRLREGEAGGQPPPAVLDRADRPAAWPRTSQSRRRCLARRPSHPRRAPTPWPGGYRRRTRGR